MRTLCALVAMGLLAFPACKQGGSQGQPGDQVKAEQKKAEEGFKRSEDAQKKATNEQQQAQSAQADVEKARKDLQEKEQKASKQQSEAQQAQTSAMAESQRAQSEGAQAQQRAQQTLQQQAAQSASSGSSSSTSELTGKLARATSSEIQLENSPQPLKIDSSTQVTLDGQPASAGQLPAGSEVRASFRQDYGEAHAIRIEAKSSK